MAIISDDAQLRQLRDQLAARLQQGTELKQVVIEPRLALNLLDAVLTCHANHTVKVTPATGGNVEAGLPPIVATGNLEDLSRTFEALKALVRWLAAEIPDYHTSVEQHKEARRLLGLRDDDEDGQ